MHKIIFLIKLIEEARHKNDMKLNNDKNCINSNVDF